MRTIREIHDALDAKRISSVELTRDYLAAIRGSEHNAYLSVCEERALRAAREADSLVAREGGKVPRDRFPLLGIPIAIKDNLHIEGIRTTCASRMLENYVAPYTATAVGRLEAAGAVTLGKLNLDEFAMGGSNENSAFGAVKNPIDPTRVPGGSSGGSAAAVRAGLCAAALGTDTGGSIRLPASYCGVFGLKPTYGRVSRYGLVAFASSLDQVGPLARHAEDAGALLEAMAGHDSLDSTSVAAGAGSYAQAARRAPDWSRLRIGLPREYLSEGVSAEVKSAIENAVRWFEGKGAKLVEISLPHTPHAVAVYYLVAVSEASSNLARFDGVRFGSRHPAAAEARNLREFYEKNRSLFGPEVKRRILLGTFALSSGYSEAYYRRACQIRRLIQRDYLEAFRQVDLIAGPVAPTTAFALNEKSRDPLQMYLNDIFTIPANLAGIPAASIPCGSDSSGLPIGLQLQAPHFGEETLFSAGGAFEGRN